MPLEIMEKQFFNSPFLEDVNWHARSQSPKQSIAIKICKLLALPVTLLLLFGALFTDPDPIKARTKQLFSLENYNASEESAVYAPHFATDASTSVVVEGGKWTNELYQTLNPYCHHRPAQIYPHSDRSTGFASFPRSGNSFVRTLVERSTGYLTSSRYCDKALAEQFKAECNKSTRFFYKQHYPAISGRNASIEHAEMNFDRVVQVSRNPLDSVYSYWQFTRAYRDKKQNLLDENIHEARRNATLGETDEQVEDVKILAQRWLEFHETWDSAKMQRLVLRYEDLRHRPLPALLSLVNFLLPDDEIPPLSDLICALELDESTEAYHSAKRPIFDSWDRYTPEMRRTVVEITKPFWCRLGFNLLASEELSEAEYNSIAVDCRGT